MRIKRFLLVFIVVGSLISTTVAVLRFYIIHDYIVFADVHCDPAIHSCFVGDGQTTPDYYSEVRVPAYLIPHCDGWKGECKELTCKEIAPNLCSQTYCAEGGNRPCHGPQATTTTSS